MQNSKIFPRLGTMRLLHLTRLLPDDDKQELLTYIGLLEQREEQLVQIFERFVNSVDNLTG